MNRYESNMQHAVYHLQRALADLRRMNRRKQYDYVTASTDEINRVMPYAQKIYDIWYQKRGAK